MSERKVYRYYRADKNEDGAFFNGVPTRDLTEDEYNELPAWLQASVDNSPLYQATKPSGDAAKAIAKAEKE